MDNITAIGIVWVKSLNLWATTYSDGQGGHIVIRLSRLRGHAIKDAEKDIERYKPQVQFTKTQLGKLQVKKMSDDTFDAMIDKCLELLPTKESK